jgi:DnaJ family protein A protein 2
MGDTFYSILEVSETATPEEIKKAYRRLSMEFHPDKNKDPNATAKFQKISEAYETLGDPDKKKQYDMTRNNPFAKMMGQNVNPGMNPMDHIFANMFGFGMPFGHMDSFGPGQHQGNGNPFVQIFHNGKPVNVQFNGGNMMKPTPIVKNITVTIEQVLNGVKMPIEIERWIATSQQPNSQEQSKTFEKETIYIDIPKGVDSGEIIILQDKGNISQNGLRGDVKLFIQVENNTEFKRRGIDLILEKTISLKEALCGFNFDVKFITGKIYTIANPGGNVIQPGHNKIIPNLGLTRDGSTGNLIIIFSVKFPEKIHDNIIEELKKLDF